MSTTLSTSSPPGPIATPRGWRLWIVIATLAVAVVISLLWGARHKAQAGFFGLRLFPPKDAYNFTLTDQNGHPFELASLRGKVVLFAFGYTHCPNFCPTTLADLAAVRRALPPRDQGRVQILFVSVDPQRDTPEVLADYAKMHGIEPGWTLLTGKPADLERLRRTLGFYDSNPELDKDTSNHIGIVRYGNEPLMRWGACPGMSTPEWIAKSVLWVDWPGGKHDAASSTAAG